MKKSQILAALALAFALGVVAPAASVYNAASVSAFSVEDGTATGEEVEKAVAAVENNKTYKQATALINAYDEYKAGLAATPAKYADFTVTAAGSLVTKANAAGITGDIAGIAASNTDATIDETKAVITAIQENAEYKVYAGLNNAIEAKDKAALIEAIKAYDAYQKANGGTETGIDTSKDGSGEPAESFTSLETALKAVAGLDLTKFDAVNTEIETVQTNIAATEAAVALLNPVLSTSGILNATGKAALANAKNVPSALAAIISNSTAYQTANFVANLNLTNWADVTEALDDAGFTDDEANAANYKKIEDIAKAYKTATNSTLDTTAIMAELIAYVPAPEDPEDPTDPTDPVESTLNDGDVTVSGAFPEGTTLKATKLDKKVAAFGENKYALYDIVLLDADGKALDFKGNINVTIKSPADIDGNKAGVFYVAENGEVKKIEAQFANGYFSFTTNQLGNYAIVENPDTVKVGDTGILGSAQGTASTTISVVAGLATALTALGAGVVAYRNARRGE